MNLNERITYQDNLIKANARIKELESKLSTLNRYMNIVMKNTIVDLKYKNLILSAFKEAVGIDVEEYQFKKGHNKGKYFWEVRL